MSPTALTYHPVFDHFFEQMRKEQKGTFLQSSQMTKEIQFTLLLATTHSSFFSVGAKMTFSQVYAPNGPAIRAENHLACDESGIHSAYHVVFQYGVFE